MAMTQAESMVQKYIEAEVAVLEGRSVSFSGRTLTMENLSEIRTGRLQWERRVAAEQARARGQSGGHSLAEFQ
ncbi:hypothetical protein SAMN05216201_11167 [Pseudomonas linyingensis]|uniref:Primosomal replication protein PriB/PriC domain protein n=1 Tax=Pseudomonas linyingensis TaxID=915471 RepID=A0A1H7A9Y5_9PSED|nr:primosomal replication protein PriB/PriC domain protein [Pseudomonas linyingensis]SEJ57835.1 hypothetical protein SAMN05216201_11167 [Pseudomonas linyingensis]